MAALAWWTILLVRKNQEIYQLEKERIEWTVSEDKAEAIANLESRQMRQKAMIFGEALVFTASLLLGIYFINRSYSKEIKVKAQQTNFLLSITHELKSPLAGIRLALDTLINRKGMDTRFEPLVMGAVKESQRLNDLTDKLLVSARMNHSFEIYPSPVSLGEFMDELVQSAKQRFSDHEIEFMSEVKTESISMDHVNMRMALDNLVENAVKYSSPGSKIDINLKESDSSINFSISDQGPGIPEAERSMVFEKFYRIGDENTRSKKGTGLGLYIAREIIKKHKGKIHILEKNGVGSTFHIEIPKRII